MNFILALLSAALIAAPGLLAIAGIVWLTKKFLDWLNGGDDE